MPIIGVLLFQPTVYDIRTGENLYPHRVYLLDALPRLREQIKPLRTYPVQVVNGAVQVGVAEK